MRSYAKRCKIFDGSDHETLKISWAYSNVYADRL